MYSELADRIMRDTGEGSIFRSILEINDYCTERLNVKIDLTKNPSVVQSNEDRMKLKIGQSFKK
jgi:hypothetical protein